MLGGLSSILLGDDARNISKNYAMVTILGIPGGRPSKLRSRRSYTQACFAFPIQKHLRVTQHRLIVPANRRLVVEQIKTHDFFYGVDWNSIRQIEAPFVPELHSVTDTSYFPTEDLDQGPEEAPAESSLAGQDLPFLGYVNFSSNSLV